MFNTLKEGRKRDAAANALLALSFAASAAQSPKDLIRSGHVEGPGTQLMSRMMTKRSKANKNLDSGRVSHPARNRTFKEFKQHCDLVLSEMTQKQHDDLVAKIEKAKTPQKKKRLKNKLDDKIELQRRTILSKTRPTNIKKKSTNTKKSFNTSTATKELKKSGSKVMNTKPMQKIKRFVSYTTLGGIMV